MMLGEYKFSTPSSVHVPPWSSFVDDPILDNQSSPYPVTAGNVNYLSGDGSPSVFSDSGYAALRQFLPSNDVDIDRDGELLDYLGIDEDFPLEAYSCDQFRMYDFKVRRCVRAKSHDWTECPYAHPGEKARRRDPRKYNYAGTACPDFRKGNCRKGDACEFAHGVFECWLHPNRYRTQPCKDGVNCRRRVCFFAHTPDQLRVVTESSPRSINSTESYDGSPLRQALEAAVSKSNLPLMLSISPPGTPTGDSSPMLSRSVGSSSVNELVASLRQLQLNKVKSMPPHNVPVMGSPVYGSPRGSLLKPGFFSLPNTPTGIQSRGTAARHLDLWECSVEEEPAMERVESGRSLRAMMFEKLRNGNPLLDRAAECSSTPDVDVGWVSELLQ
ncbi:unnamed protein product [Rhodiola kirilowii]